jgi:uncharacterized protein (DUF2235 family)
MASTSREIIANLDYSGAPRHLLVFLDGTWNDENGKDNNGITTNIYKLFRCLEGDLKQGSIPHIIEHEKHLALYFRGIGNDDDNSMLGSWFYGAFGGSEKRIRDHAYSSVIGHYRKGDRITILGFSRGAASARLLATDLGKNGIRASITIHAEKEKNKSTGLKEDVYKKYSNLSETQLDVNVEFLGIFDTVGAFGLPIDIGIGFQKINLFKDMSVSKCVKKVVHCVSIDESREPFIPTLCNYEEHIDELWFAGVHADIGGGYRHSDLGKIPLKYMVEQLQKNFLDNPVAFNSEKLSQLIEYNIDEEFHLHYHGDGFKKKSRVISVLEKDKLSKRKPRIHSSVNKLINSKKLFLNVPMAGFSRIKPIRYCPISVNGLMGKYKEEI